MIKFTDSYIKVLCNSTAIPLTNPERIIQALPLRCQQLDANKRLFNLDT